VAELEAVLGRSPIELGQRGTVLLERYRRMPGELRKGERIKVSSPTSPAVN
jgi:hypothetical protein